MAVPKPGIERAIEIACKRLSERALKVLENALDPAKTPGIDYKMRIMAAQELLSRAWGKPKASVDNKITVEGGEALIDILRQAKIRSGLPGDKRLEPIIQAAKLN